MVDLVHVSYLDAITGVKNIHQISRCKFYEDKIWAWLSPVEQKAVLLQGSEEERHE